MSDEIRTHDEQHGRKQAWHGRTRVNPDLSLDDENFYLSQWEPTARKLAVLGGEVPPIIERDGKPAKVGGKGTPKFEVTPAWEAVLSRHALTADDLKGISFPMLEKLLRGLHGGVQSTDYSALFVPPNGSTITEALPVSTPYTESYSPLSNKNFLALIRKSLLGLGLKMDVESVGSVFDRRRVFLSILLPEMTEFEAGGRKFSAFLNFINSFDMSTPFMANTSNICIVCNNTLQMNLAAGGCMVKHTKNMPEKLDKLPDVIAEALTTQRAFANDFLTLAGFDLSPENAKWLFAAFVSDGVLSTRSLGTVERLCQLFKGGAGNKGKDYSDAFSAVTDYYTHESSGGDEKPEKQFASSEFGSGANTKRQAIGFFLKCCDDSEFFAKQIATGEQAIKDYNVKADERDEATAQRLLERKKAARNAA